MNIISKRAGAGKTSPADNKRFWVKKACFVTASMVLSLQMYSVNAMDVKGYIKIANHTVQEANGGFISNINQLLTMQERLIEMGVDGSKEYIKKHPEHADVLGEVIIHAESMKRMTLDEIEDQWHMGKHMASKGYDMEKFDHFGPLFSLMDSIIHPATAYISLKEYKRTRNTDFLARASGELIEVIEHVKHLNDKDKPQLTQN